jgi:hypothetical protein
MGMYSKGRTQAIQCDTFLDKICARCSCSILSLLIDLKPKL